jgi:MYXO-CTERM domain-containing protein
MPIPTPSRSVRALAAGATLASCSLVSAGSTLLFSTLEAASGFASLGSTTGNFSYSGPTNSMSVPLTIGAGSGSGFASAYGIGGGLPGFDLDVFFTKITTTAAYTSGVSNVSFTVTLGASAAFVDLGVFEGYVASWTLNSASLTNGDAIAAGTHTFVGTFLYDGTGTAGITSYSMGFVLLQSNSSAVPLPGAAGLAAFGLAGLHRRRRR